MRRNLHIVLGFVTTLCAFASSPANAVQLVSTCNATCTTDCELNKNLNCCPTYVSGCDGEGPITLTNGAYLDLHGYTIHCNGDGVSQWSVCNYLHPAVKMTSSSSVVKNNLGSSGYVSKIDGFWLTGVDCANKTGSRVTGIQFEDIALNDVLNCSKVDANVFLGGLSGGIGRTAVQSSGVAGTDAIFDNYIENYYTGILITGSKGVGIDHNVIALLAPDAGYYPVGIDVSGATASTLSVHHNVLMRDVDSAPISGNSVSSFSKNACDRLNPQCVACGTSNWCSKISAPYPGMR